MTGAAVLEKGQIARGALHVGFSAPLGNITKLPSARVVRGSAEQHAKTAATNDLKRATRRESRFLLRDFVGKISTVRRVAMCGRVRISKGTNPTVRMSGGVAHFTGFQQCGSVHLCTVCAPIIRNERSQEIDRAAGTWLEQHGAGSIMLVTLTVPHSYGERLADVLSTVREALSTLHAGRAWQADKAAFGLKHYIAAHDQTVGVNGWHPHLHNLLFAERELTDDDVSKLEARLYERWADAVVKHGGASLEEARFKARARAEPGRRVGVRVPSRER